MSDDNATIVHLRFPVTEAERRAINIEAGRRGLADPKELGAWVGALIKRELARLEAVPDPSELTPTGRDT